MRRWVKLNGDFDHHQSKTIWRTFNLWVTCKNEFLIFNWQIFAVSLIALPFLSTSLFGYLLVGKMTGLHGRIVISYVISIAVFHVSSAIVQLDHQKLWVNHPLGCKLTGYVGNFSILSSFCWLIVMCYDVRSFKWVVNSNFYLYQVNFNINTGWLQPSVHLKKTRKLSGNILLFQSQFRHCWIYGISSSKA